jgi:hypothetical protein
MSNAGREETEDFEPSLDACEEIHEVVLKVFKKCPKDFRVVLGTLFSMALVDETIFDIETVEDLKAKLGEITATQMQQFSVSSDVARKILGYGVRTEVHDGRKFSVYYPVDGCGKSTRGATFFVPEKIENEIVVDIFPSLILTACLKVADGFGIKDALTPCEDMDAYYTAAEKGGKYRGVAFVKANPEGDLICKDDGTLSVYDLDGVKQITLVTEAGEKSYPFSGQLVDYFTSVNLIVDPEGPHKLGDGITASGPYDPTSFTGGVPDATLETLETVIGLMNIDKNLFIKRYDSYLRNPPTKKKPEQEEKRSSQKPAKSAAPAPAKPEVYVPPAMRGRGATRGGNATRGSRSERGWTATMRKSADASWPGDKFEDVSGGGKENPRQNQQTPKSWQNIEEKAAAALIWLKNKNGCQMSALEQKFVDIHAYAYDVHAYVGKGSRRAGLINFIRSIGKAKQASLADLAQRASEEGLLPPVTLSGEEGEFEASDVLVLTLVLLKVCASIKIVRRDGLKTVVYWDNN